MSEHTTFAGGADEVIALYLRRRNAIGGSVDLGMPPVDVDLTRAKATIVVPSDPFRFQSFTPQPVETPKKLTTLSGEMAGSTELELLHAYCISQLRKRTHHPNALELFFRLWDEEADFLLERLTNRWTVSAIITYGDHGPEPIHRVVGTSFNIFFSLIKLYESERQFSGVSGDQAYEIKNRKRGPTPIGLGDFSVRNGDLHTNLLGKLYMLTEGDDITQRIGRHLLAQLNSDEHNIFRRVNLMRDSPE